MAVLSSSESLHIALLDGLRYLEISLVKEGWQKATLAAVIQMWKIRGKNVSNLTGN
jgi:hypothetical protein